MAYILVTYLAINVTDGTTSAPMSILRYEDDKVKLFVPIWGTLLQCQCPDLNSLAIRLRGEDLQDLILGKGVPKLQG